jgi:hypothetical protein
MDTDNHNKWCEIRTNDECTFRVSREAAFMSKLISSMLEDNDGYFSLHIVNFVKCFTEDDLEIPLPNLDTPTFLIIQDWLQYHCVVPPVKVQKVSILSSMIGLMSQNSPLNQMIW